jgi:hypothetical protein
MSSPEVLFWQRVAEDLDVDIVTPFEATFSDGSRLRVSALVKNFATTRGMLVNADYDVLEPHKHKIVESGYGYSSNLGGPPDQYERSSMIDVLKDWGWSGAADQKPDWLG